MNGALNFSDPVLTFAAALPVLAILLLAAGLRWSTARAGAAAWVVTLAAVLFLFHGGPALVAVSQAKALIMGLDVLYIVWGALLFHRVCEEAGVEKALGGWIAGSVQSAGLRVLAIAWVFASFLQGAGGFGVPVVITAPLLAGIGFPPLSAVLLPSVGHAWAVTFGSLGTSFQALMAASGLSAAELGPDSALVLGAGCLVCGLLVGVIALRGKELLHAVPVILLLAGAMGGTQYLLAAHGLWQVGSLGGGLAGVGIVFLIAWRGRRAAKDPAPVTDGRVRAGLTAYALLVGIILAARWTGPLAAVLESGSWSVPFPEITNGLGMVLPAENSARLAPFAHAGALLAYSSLAAYLLFARMGLICRGAPGRILGRLVRSALPVSIGILFMVGISTLMTHAGMTAVLSDGLIRLAGPAFPLLAPWVGGFGAFLTGSNTNSNLLFAPLQQRLAGRLGRPAPVLLAAQTAGGAAGSVLSPAKVVVGTGAAEGGVREGDVIRRLWLPVALLLAVFSVCTALLPGGS
jgi:lactate permease